MLVMKILVPLLIPYMFLLKLVMKNLVPLLIINNQELIYQV